MRRNSEQILDNLIETRLQEAIAEEKQRLVDLCFSLVITANMHKDWFNTLDRDAAMDWVTDQLASCGYYTHRCGVSWGVLASKEKAEKITRMDRNIRAGKDPNID